MEQQQYEFSEKENILVGSLAKKMKFVGIFGIIFGILEILQGIFSDKTAIVQGLISIIIGIWTTKASESFQKIVDTQGNDISYLLGALDQLKKLFSLQYWTYLIGAIIVIITIISILIFGISTTNH
jgi:hypothetical protein